MKLKEYLETLERNSHYIAMEFPNYSPKWAKCYGHELAFRMLLKELPKRILNTEIGKMKEDQLTI